MKPSRSIQSFKSADLSAPVTTPPRRAPSSSEIDHKRRSQQQLHSTPIFGAAKPPQYPPLQQQQHPAGISDTQSEKSHGSSGKKEVTSRIANLWKKVEDSKKKDPKEKDSSKVWISKGKVIPESERALIKPDEKQRELINKFQADQKAKTAAAAAAVADKSANEQGHGLKPRSKSRLSIRLSKFSLNSSKKDLTAINKTGNATTPTDSKQHLCNLTNGDSVNGNWARQNYEIEPTRRNRFENDPRSEESSESMSTGTDTEISNDPNKSKRMSRLGTFLNPTAEEEERIKSDVPRPTVRTSNRSPSAIVTPFNYNPPTMTTTVTSVTESGDKRTSVASLKPGSKIATAVRRNDSYASSMGRDRPDKRDENIVNDDDGHQDTSHTSSVVVTLV